MPRRVSQPPLTARVEESANRIIFENIPADLQEPVKKGALIVKSPTDFYVLREELGQGGMGTVRKATRVITEGKGETRGNIVLQTDCAIKEVNLASEYFSVRVGETMQALDDLSVSFRSEVRLASKLKHPNIVGITDFGTNEDNGAPYYVMEYLHGWDLETIVRQTGPIPWPQARDIILQVCSALNCAHSYVNEQQNAMPIVHLDIKPGNIFIERTEHDDEETQTVKVLDFGLAKALPSLEGQTQRGNINGTPEYMAPEQAYGQPMDMRTDIYAVGAVLYEMMCGRAPLQHHLEKSEDDFRDAENPSKAFSEYRFEQWLKFCDKIANEIPASLLEVAPERGIPPEVDRIVHKCLEKNPASRYQSMRDLRDDLANCKKDGSVGEVRLNGGGAVKKKRAVSDGYSKMLIDPRLFTTEKIGPAVPLHSESTQELIGPEADTMLAPDILVVPETKPRRRSRLPVAIGVIGLAAVATLGVGHWTRAGHNRRMQTGSAALASTMGSNEHKGAMKQPGSEPLIDTINGKDGGDEAGRTAQERFVKVTTGEGGVLVLIDGKEACRSGVDGFCLASIPSSTQSFALTLRKHGYADLVRNVGPGFGDEISARIDMGQPKKRESAAKPIQSSAPALPKTKPSGKIRIDSER